MSTTTSPEIFDTLREVFGFDEFRAGQEEVVRAVLAGRDAFVVRPTGSGKSLLFQLPALHLPGLTIVVSPLIALMKDQHDRLAERGVEVVTVNSSLTRRAQTAAELMVERGEARILYVTPERFRDRDFFESLRDQQVSLFVVDEAHCVSQWGHDFRPDYMMLGAIVERLGRPPVLALTATAPPHVRDDIIEQLRMRGPFISVAGLIRPNLFLSVRRTVNEAAKAAELERLLGTIDGTGIVYVATVRQAEQLCAELAPRWPVELYHGRRSAKQRTEAQERFMSGSAKAVVATNAFGLGIDKPDIRFIVHYDFPGSLEAYYQEAGRAGRDGGRAECVILYRVEDRQVQSYFLGGKYPSLEEAAAVARVLNATPPGERRPLAALAAAADVPRRKTRIVLELLKREGGMREYRGGEWERLADDVARIDIGRHIVDYEARRARDREKLDAMVSYCRSAQCRTRRLLEYFGAPPGPVWECGHCDNDAARGNGVPVPAVPA
ncbi:MAG TPA: ATP-dependent DNA helicase RecQ, partial [Longimicrobiales bacterium]|nr:ATP-dependent DNA helicase RecQ [Longimicrobiales bacterium]